MFVVIRSSVGPWPYVLGALAVGDPTVEYLEDVSKTVG